MSADDDTDADDAFSAWLEEYAAALAAGSELPALDGTTVAPQLRERYRRGAAGLHLLQMLRPAPTTSAGDRCPTTVDAVSATGQLGRFFVLRELGAGGFGIVFLAHDPRLGRQVALKVPRAEVALTPALSERFRREARAASALDHPNIVPVYEVIEVGPVCCIVSAYCPGVTLAQWLRENPVPVSFRDAAAFMATLADAIHHAHERGVIHRDLKPANVLLSPGTASPAGAAVGQQEGAVAATGLMDGAIPKITDFGLAKVLPESAAEAPTRSGAVMGTPSYMAPEQARGSNRQVGPAADVYALGAIFYELLTGRPPFQGDNDLETLRLVQSNEPVPPASLRPRMPRDLQTICLQCLHKERQNRYASAAKLADDLRRFLADQPIAARRPGRRELLWRWCRRRPLTAGLTAAVFLLGIALVVGSVLAALRFEADRDRLALAQAQTKKELFQSFLSRVRAGRRSGLPGRRLETLGIFGKTLRLREDLGLVGDVATTRELRNELISCLVLADLYPTRHLQTFPAANGPIALDGKLQRYAYATADGRICVARMADNEQVIVLRGKPGKCEVLQLSADGEFLAAIRAAGGTLEAWQVETGQPLPLEDSAATAIALAFRPHGAELFVCRNDGLVCVYGLPSGKLQARLPLGVVTAIAFDPPGNRVALIRKDDPTLHIFGVPQMQEVARLEHPGKLMNAAWSADAGYLAVACDSDRRIHLWDTTTLRERKVLSGHDTWTTAGMAFHPDGDVLASFGWDASVRLWDLTSGQQLFHASAAAHQLSFTNDGRWLVGPIDGTAPALWQVETGREYRTLSGNGAIAVSPDSQWLAAPMQDGAHLWELATGKEVALVPSGFTSAVLFAPDGNALFTYGQSGLQCWPLARGSGSVQGPPEQILPLNAVGESLSVSADGQTLAAAVRFRGGMVIRLDESRKRGPLLAHPGALGAALSPDGRWLATATFRGQGIRIWDATTGTLSGELVPEENHTVIGFSPDGSRFVAGTSGGYRIWRVEDRALLHSLPHAGGGEVGAFAFANSGKLLALETAPARVELFDVDSWQSLACLEDPLMQESRWLAFSPDGAYLVASMRSPKSIHIWNIRRIRQQLAERGLDWQG